MVSDEPDSEGYYTIQWNQAPTTPPGITVPDSVKSGKDAAISWAASTDPESDDITYQLDPLEQQHERMGHDLHRQQHQLYRHRHHHGDGQRAVARPREG